MSLYNIDRPNYIITEALVFSKLIATILKYDKSHFTYVFLTYIIYTVLDWYFQNYYLNTYDEIVS
jgi:hypothetical protein